MIVLNIAIFCHDYTLSGANMSLLDWLKDSSNGKYHFTVILPKNGTKFIQTLASYGINDVIIGHYYVSVKKLYKTNIKEKIKDFLKYIYSLLINPFMYKKIQKELEKRKIDIIHTNSFAALGGAYIARKMRKPHIFHIREFMEEDHQITHFNKKKVFEYCNHSYAIFISDVIAEKYKKMYNFLGTQIIYNKIAYNDSYKKEREFLQDNICNLLFVGSIAVNKGPMDAVKLIEKLNDSGVNSKLYFCGSGPYEDQIKKYIHEKSIKNIEMLGYQSNVIELRKKMDIALMCSEKEALGRVTIEAQYYENLIIGADCGCTPYIIEDGVTGFLYNKKIENDLYDKVMTALNNKGTSKKIIEVAKEKAIKKFSNSIYEKIIKFYNAIV